MPCKKAHHPNAPKDKIKIFKTFVGEYHQTALTVGTRNWNFNLLGPITASVSFPSGTTAKKVYLYWNTITGIGVNLNKMKFTNTLDSTYTIRGKLIGWCGNTCWTKDQADFDADPEPQSFLKSNIINKVYRADVTKYVDLNNPGGDYDFEVVGASNVPDMAGEPEANFPGCKGTQGLVLLFIVNDPCDPDDSEASNTTGKRKIIIYDGAVNINPYPELGKSSHTLLVSPGEYTDKAIVLTTCGDAQDYPDSLSWNGTPFPTSGGSYWTPNEDGSCGGSSSGSVTLINTKAECFENLIGFTAKRKNNELKAETTSDCLCWFLATYMGEKICCAYIPKLVSNSPCVCPNSPRLLPNALKDKLTFFKGFIGDIDYTAGAVGTRDIDTNITPANVTVNFDGTVIAAYLYWNVIGAGNWTPNKALITPPTAEDYGYIEVEGCMIGWCGNTCWQGCCQCTGNVPEDIPYGSIYQQTANKVYRADVTRYVRSPGTYTVRLPTVKQGHCIAEMMADQPYLPECRSSQGIVLLVIYDKGPEHITQDSCCPGYKSRFLVRKQILISDGCVLVNANPQPGPFGGGYPAYSVYVSSHYKNNIKILNGVGDAQSDLKDQFLWNGEPLNEPCTSYFNPVCGNLLHCKQEVFGGKSKCDCKAKVNVATASSGPCNFDCLSWFLFVYYGELACVTPVVTKVTGSAARGASKC